MKKSPILTSLFLFTPVILFLAFAAVKITLAQNCQTSALHQGLISALSVSGGTIGNSDQTCVLNSQATYRDFNVPSYSDLESQYYTFSKSSAKKSSQLPNGALPAFTENGIYRQNSSLSISSATGTGAQIIFVSGNLTITNNITYANADPYSGLVFITSGDINIASTVTQVNAVLISSGKICTAYDTGASSCLSGFTVTPQLIVNGSLISLNKTPLPNGQSALLMKRNLTTNNQPAEVINKQPKFLYILRNGLFTKDLILTQENKNYVIPSYTPAPSPSQVPSPSPSPSPSASPSPTPNPLFVANTSYWKMDETTGTTIADSKGGRTGTLTGTVSTTGKIINARQFTTASDSIATSAVNLNLTRMTVTAWIMPTGTAPAWNAIVSQFENASGQNAWNLSYNTSYNLHFNIVGSGCSSGLGTTISASVPPVANKWYFVAVTKNELGVIKFYIDGVKVDERSTSITTTCQNAIPIRFGKFPWNNNERLVGKLDEVGIWTDVLSDAQIASLYNLGVGTPYSP